MSLNIPCQRQISDRLCQTNFKHGIEELKDVAGVTLNMAHMRDVQASAQLWSGD